MCAVGQRASGRYLASPTPPTHPPTTWACHPTTSPTSVVRAQVSTLTTPPTELLRVHNVLDHAGMQVLLPLHEAGTVALRVSLRADSGFVLSHAVFGVEVVPPGTPTMRPSLLVESRALGLRARAAARSAAGRRGALGAATASRAHRLRVAVIGGTRDGFDGMKVRDQGLCTIVGRAQGPAAVCVCVCVCQACRGCRACPPQTFFIGYLSALNALGMDTQFMELTCEGDGAAAGGNAVTSALAAAGVTYTPICARSAGGFPSWDAYVEFLGPDGPLFTAGTWGQVGACAPHCLKKGEGGRRHG
jgi:hypothetical protein